LYEGYFALKDWESARLPCDHEIDDLSLEGFAVTAEAAAQVGGVV
jgi:hypothetical protein